jgi:hypothetical protein
MGGGNMLLAQQQLQNKFFLQQLQQHQQKQMLLKQQISGNPMSFPTSGPKSESFDPMSTDGDASAAATSTATKTEGESQALGASLGFGMNTPNASAAGIGGSLLGAMPQVINAPTALERCTKHLCMSAWGGRWVVPNLPCCTTR